jgi:hypothetical protein
VISLHRRLALALALAVSPFVLTAACSSVETGKVNPTATTGATPSINTTQPGAPTAHSKAPPVKQPIDASKYVTNPCSSLTYAQVTGIGGSEAGKPGDNGSGPGCTWRVGSNFDTSIRIAYLTATQTGLSNIYALNDTGEWKGGYFEPTEISGYPAAFVSGIDIRAKGDCTFAVGITDELMFTVIVQSRAGNDSCTAAKNVSSEVLKTIQRGS